MEKKRKDKKGLFWGLVQMKKEYRAPLVAFGILAYVIELIVLGVLASLGVIGAI
jgi:hypothetical protein